LASGASVRPALIQQAYLDAARQVSQTEADQHVIGLWQRTLDAWETQNFAGLETELDWLAKLRLIERYRERTGAALADLRVRRLELAYHALGPTGLRPQLEAAGALASVIDLSKMQRAVLEPPPTTRAHLRGQFVAAARAAGREYSVDWVRLKLGEGPALTLLDPLDNHYAPAQNLLKDLAAVGGTPVQTEFDQILARAAGGEE
jgi:proteasome accessory factor A